MSKVSIIVPVYNVEKYIKRCLDSLINQTLKDIEIICINDCSPDNSLSILYGYADRDKRVKIIDFEKNQGVAIARNAGLEIAKGEYIGFVDPDDWVDLDFYSTLYNTAIQNDLDVVKGGIKLEKDKSITVYEGLPFNYESKFKYQQYFWSGIYKNELIKRYNLTFLDNCIYSQDRLFAFLTVYYAKSFKKVDNVFYRYFSRDNSTTKMLTSKHLKAFILVFNKLIEFVNNAALDNEDYLNTIRMFLETALGHMWQIDITDLMPYIKDLKASLSKILDKELLNNELDQEVVSAIEEENIPQIKQAIIKRTQKIYAASIRKKVMINK